MVRKHIKRVDGRTHEQPDPDEMLRRRVFIRNLFSSGLPKSEIVEVAALPVEKGGHGLSQTQVEYVLREIREDLRVEMELAAPTNKAVALNRLYRDLAAARADLGSLRASLRDPLTGKPAPASAIGWRAVSAQQATVLRVERLIAEMEGTLDPIKVDVGLHGLSEPLQRAFSGMTDEQIAEALEEERQLLRDAGAVVTTGLENPGSQAASVPRAEESPPPRRAERPALPAPGPSGLAPSQPETPPGQRRKQSPGKPGQGVRPRADGDPGAGARGIGARVVT